MNYGTHRKPKLGVRFIDFEWENILKLINAKVSCKCRNKLHLPVRTVVLVFSVQTVSVLDGFVAYEFLRCR